ncbi:MAG: hypothetical protein KDA65_00390 [Planctomycetaceae bacterium]|nr:hypothetical protein [Planctomycetaceae bacterium]
MKHHPFSIDSTRFVIQDRIQRVASLVDSGHYQDALHMLSSGNTTLPEIRNARGVCLMRMKRYRESLDLFKSLVIPLNCTWMRPELPVIYRANLVTALILAQLPQGAHLALLEIQEQDHPSIIRLRQVMERWISQLSWPKWLQWKYGFDINEPISLDFPPGEIIDPFVSDLIRQFPGTTDPPLPAHPAA